MTTIVIQIGNSDDKLTQREWCNYANEITKLLGEQKASVHFSGGSHPFEPWQNAAWVLQFDVVKSANDIEIFKQQLTEIRVKFNQESLAFTVGDTQFV